MQSIKPDWFQSSDEVRVDLGDLVEMYHTFHPKVYFLKTLRFGARVLDVGAGDGSLLIFRDWIKPARKDLKLYAYAMEVGEHFPSYDDYEIGEWPAKKPDFDSVKFDAIFAAHFIEHIEDPAEFINWCATRLNPEGRIYLEWPSLASTIQPRVDDFHESDVPLIISNYWDDTTHRLSLPDREAIKLTLGRAGVVIDQEGVITNPYFDDEVLAHFSAENLRDEVTLTLAYWSHSRWAQYLVGSKLQPEKTHSLERNR